MNIPFFSKRKEREKHNQRLSVKVQKQRKKFVKDMKALKSEARGSHRASVATLRKSKQTNRAVKDLATQTALILQTR